MDLVFFDYLLRPDDWLRDDNEEAKEKFKFSIEEVAQLTKQCLDIVASQPNILKVSAPVKVFGDIHGQYIDLMNFFDKWGCPSESISGDIMSNDYLFLNIKDRIILLYFYFIYLIFHNIVGIKTYYINSNI